MSATYDFFYWEDLGSGVFRLRDEPEATNFPDEEDVKLAIPYGPGLVYTGTYECPSGTCDYPIPGDVREGVEYAYGDYTGTLIAGGSIPIAGDLQQKMIGYIHTAFAVPVVIKRGAVTTTTNAIPADHLIDYMGGEAVEMQSIDRVFRIRCDAYRFGGILSTPQGSDVVTWDGHDWEVIRRLNYAVPGYRNEYALPTKRKT